MAIYRAQSYNGKPLSMISIEQRLSNQIVISGTDETMSLPNGVFFLEYLEADTGTTVTIEDGSGNTICSGMSSFNNEICPLRCDYGFTITGDVTIAKGFVLDGVFA